MAQRISVVIPNYNGMKLLEKNLPAVIKNCPGAEIIVVDDGSVDGSVRLLHKKFKKIKLLKLKKNVGFSKAVNAGVRFSSGRLTLLLNSDVVPKNNMIAPLLGYFKNESTFAVGIEDFSHDERIVKIKGRGGAQFRRGFVNHYALAPERGKTLWVSAGSGIFDKNKFLKLGGLDNIYKPFYWEDIDLSFRAWRSGYKCYFEPLSKADHFHEDGAIITQKSKTLIKASSYKNQFIFVWKNISDYKFICLHVLWLPYHFVKAFISCDAPFFIGFFWAVLKMPKLVLDETLKNNSYAISEREVLKIFESRQ